MRLLQRDVTLVDIDLRWGITQQQAENDQVLGLCLRQIDECRPFFIGLLGGRYGWVPSKFPVEVDKQFGWTQHYTNKSMTELEILHGVLNDPTMHKRALFCFRSERFLTEITDEQQHRVFEEGSTDEELQKFGTKEAERLAQKRYDQLKELKLRIKNLSPQMPLFEDYPCHWNKDLPNDDSNSNGRLDGLNDFGDWLIKNLEHIILTAPELSEHIKIVRTTGTLDELNEERYFHEQFIESRTHIYIGQEHLQDMLKLYVTGTEAKPCLIKGPSGSGKSAALAKFVSTWRTQNSQYNIIPYFVGASPRSTNLRDMLWYLCMALKDLFSLKDEIMQDVRELADQFLELLGKLPTNCNTLLVIDALNQFENVDHTDFLHWIPPNLPHQVRLIISCIDDPDESEYPIQSALELLGLKEIRVDFLSDMERIEIIAEIPSMAAKTLDESQIQMLLKNEATRNPLFLLVALEDLRTFGSFEKLNQRIAKFPQSGDTLTEIFKQVIKRLLGEFNAGTVKDLLTLLVCSRYGLSERELLDLIEGKGVSSTESVSDIFPILRLLRPYLQSRGSLIDFHHRHFREAVIDIFQLEVNRFEIHSRIAEYFSGQPWFIESSNLKQKNKLSPKSKLRKVNFRKVEELPYLLIVSESWTGTESLLTTTDFLEAACQSDRAYELLSFYSQALIQLPDQSPTIGKIRMLEAALRFNINFIAAHSQEFPHAIFQCLWNFCAWNNELRPWLDHWREKRDISGVSCPWMRSLLEAPIKLDSPVQSILIGHEDSINCLASSLNGKTIVSGSRDGTVRVWDGVSGRERFCFRLSDADGLFLGAVSGVAVSFDGSLIFAADNSKKVWRWDGFTGQQLKPLLVSFDVEVDQIAFETKSSTSLVATCKDGSVILWQVAKPNPNELNMKDVISCLSSWRIANPKPTVLGKFEDGSPTINLWQLTVVASGNGIVRAWRIDTMEEIWSLPIPSDSLSSVALSQSGLLALNFGSSMALLDLPKAELLFEIQPHSEFTNTLNFSEDGKLIVTGGGDNLIKIWDAVTGLERLQLSGHEDRIFAVTFAAEDELVVSGSNDGTVRVWNLKNAKLEVSERPKPLVQSVAVSGDGSTVVSGDNENHVRIWDTETGIERFVLSGHSLPITSVDLSTDGQIIVSGSEDCNIHIWNGYSGVLLRTLEEHVGTILAVALSPDESTLVSGGEDSSIRVWDVKTGQMNFELDPNEEYGNPIPLNLQAVLTKIICKVKVRHFENYIVGTISKTLNKWDPRAGKSFKKCPQRSKPSLQSDNVEKESLPSPEEFEAMLMKAFEKAEQDNDKNNFPMAHIVGLVIPVTDNNIIVSGTSDLVVRVWNAHTGELHDIIEGAYVRKPFTPCGDWNAQPEGRATVIRHNENGTPVGWLPGHFKYIDASDNGIIWACIENGRLSIFRIENLK